MSIWHVSVSSMGAPDMATLIFFGGAVGPLACGMWDSVSHTHAIQYHGRSYHTRPTPYRGPCQTLSYTERSPYVGPPCYIVSCMLYYIMIHHTTSPCYMLAYSISTRGKERCGTPMSIANMLHSNMLSCIMLINNMPHSTMLNNNNHAKHYQSCEYIPC